MQSAAKLTEASNIFKLSDITNKAVESSSNSEAAKKSAANVSGSKEDVEPGPSQTTETAANEKSVAPVAPAPAGDDALAWLKIIESATADLTADLRATRSETSARSDGGTESFRSYAAASSPLSLGAARSSGGFDRASMQDEHSDERKLAEKLSYRFAEPRNAPPQSLRAALMPYVAATGIFAFLAGSAAAYFLMGFSSSDVKARVAPPSVESQLDPLASRPEQVNAKKGGFQRAASPAASGGSASSWGRKADDQPARPADADASAPQPLATWSDTVETFKQFVKPEQNAR